MFHCHHFCRESTWCLVPYIFVASWHRPPRYAKPTNSQILVSRGFLCQFFSQMKIRSKTLRHRRCSDLVVSPFCHIRGPKDPGRNLSLPMFVHKKHRCCVCSMSRLDTPWFFRWIPRKIVKSVHLCWMRCLF